MTTTEVFTLVLSFLLALLLTGLIKVLVVHFGVVDQPGVRRSHQVVTPRGGGWSIVLTVFAYMAISEKATYLLWPALAWVAFLGIIISGWLDDIYDLSAKLRIVVQVFASSLFVLVLFPEQSAWVQLTYIMLMLWFINMYNFMDGIDLMLVSQLSFVIFGMLILWPDSPFRMVLLVILGSVIGFGVYNWPPAKIFMGDVGSTFIGMLVAALAIGLPGTEHGDFSILAAILLSGVFLTDAGYTLLYRFLTGQSVFEAHNIHNYQLMAKLWGHGRVVLIYAGINIMIVLPTVWLIYSNQWSVLLYLPTAMLLTVAWWVSRVYTLKQLEIRSK
ncbi:MAG: MraY family glycosyltransferase [bacterium]